MNRIHQVFKQKKQNILSVYFTAGFPSLNDTGRILQMLEKYGADMAEIGIPFSDPVADGEVIQQSSLRALQNGMNLNLLFEQLADIRQTVSMPLVLMGYLNPVYRMGFERFVEKCSQVGIDGLIIPDFPLSEMENASRQMLREADISNILLITPQTPEARIREIDAASDGFVYMVSSYATTGNTQEFSPEQTAYFRRVQSMKLSNPVLAGFGVSNRSTFESACLYANGAITGSAFIKAISADGKMEDKVKGFLLEYTQ